MNTIKQTPRMALPRIDYRGDEQEARSRALTEWKRVKLNWTDTNPGHVLYDVSRYLTSTYMFNDNPLGRLRTYFPTFDWEYRELTDCPTNEIHVQTLARVIHNADIVFNLGTNTYLAIARRKECVPGELRRLCFQHSDHWERTHTGRFHYKLVNSSLWSPVAVRTAQGQVVGYNEGEDLGLEVLDK